jgi:hypothetical protein
VEVVGSGGKQGGRTFLHFSIKSGRRTGSVAIKNMPLQEQNGPFVKRIIYYGFQTEWWRGTREMGVFFSN